MNRSGNAGRAAAVVEPGLLAVWLAARRRVARWFVASGLVGLGLVGLGLAALGMGGCTGPRCEVYSVPASKAAAAEAQRYVRVTMRTTAGDIELELDRMLAPIGVENFLGYARRGDYDGTVFHRVVPGFVVQGGGMRADLVELPGGPPIANEWTNGLKNVRGTIAWAREAEPDSATRQFFINVADNERLDRARDVSGHAGYAVFGRVTRGMEVVDAIVARAAADGGSYELPEREMKNVPREPVAVTGVEIAER